MTIARRLITFCLLVLGVVAVNAFLGLQILGLTYRPFSWMTLCEAGELTLYPVMLNPVASGDGVALTVHGRGGTVHTLERTASLSPPEWESTGVAVVDTGEPATLLDTNPPAQGAFYRVSELPIP